MTVPRPHCFSYPKIHPSIGIICQESVSFPGLWGNEPIEKSSIAMRSRRWSVIIPVVILIMLALWCWPKLEVSPDQFARSSAGKVDLEGKSKGRGAQTFRFRRPMHESGVLSLVEKDAFGFLIPLGSVISPLSALLSFGEGWFWLFLLASRLSVLFSTLFKRSDAGREKEASEPTRVVHPAS